MKTFLIRGVRVNIFWAGDVKIDTKDEILSCAIMGYMISEGFFESDFLEGVAN